MASIAGGIRHLVARCFGLGRSVRRCIGKAGQMPAMPGVVAHAMLECVEGHIEVSEEGFGGGVGQLEGQRVAREML